MDDSSGAAPVANDDGDDWPDDHLAMMQKMLAEQSASLHLMFYDLRDFSAETFRESPRAAEGFIRLALRAQANCRSSLDAMARADRAARDREAAAK
ncbi:hypothetical protein [Rhizorhabdus dicambivorans]|uniref:Phasin domain-containing protein n=1 Tax=Rhizorhabdus dicambivorans TaxID=1850238 RepID=A0A2A4FS57_9SPHN|nr:hypothetical protein [Rhizorhabdus dicambivorans]ATE65638.1 hypothetical protein CMV14_15515 [Rhizorhabdus dicambivorans]PCE40979.1 hypothetical protein COO09_17425 [Rhizorhabdus dicambivorans]